MSRAIVFLALLLVSISSAATAQATSSSTPKAAAPSVQITAKHDFLLPEKSSITLFYCDRALPYMYRSHPASVELAVQVTKPGWGGYLNSGFAALDSTKAPLKDPFTNDSVAPPPSTVPKTSPAAPTPDTPDFDPLKDIGKWLYDNGSPLLTDSNSTMTAPRAQRLLVRTLFGPNPFTAPCSYHYLTDPAPPAPGTILYSPTGDQESLVVQGGLGPTPLHFSFLDKAAPEFYLINITQWNDSPAPTGAPTNPAPKYYAASDKWFLLNFKHPEKNQDITKLVFRAGLAPELVGDVPELMGKSVILLGIQLAPIVPLPSTPSTKNFAITPTEQSWYDDVKIQYKIHADAVTSLQMQDLSALVQAAIAAAGASNFLNNANSSSTAAPAEPVASTTSAPGAVPPPPPAQATADNKPSTVPNSTADLIAQTKDLVKAINADAVKLQDSPTLVPSALLLFLRGVVPLDVQRNYGLSCTSTCAPLLSYGEPATGFVIVNTAVADSIGAIKSDQSISDRARGVAQATAVTDLTADISALKATQAVLDADVKVDPSSPMSKAKATVSLNQGRYVAGLITSIQGLPLKLTPSWAATFPTVVPASALADAATPNSTITSPPTSPTSSVPPTPTNPSQGPSPVNSDPSPPVPDILPEAPQAAPQSAASTTKPAVQAKAATPPSAASQSADPSTPAPAPTAAPADICTAALAADKASQAPCAATDAGTILDEHFSHFDFTAAVSVTGYKDLTIQSASTTGSSVATNATVTRENAYGLVDLFIIPEDLANPPVLGFPHFAVGLPFAGQIFDKPYFAVGETINLPKLFGKSSKLANIPGLNVLGSDQFPLQIHPVFGYVWNKESSVANGVITKYRDFRPQWSIEIPFRSVANLVTSFTKSSSSSASK